MSIIDTIEGNSLLRPFNYLRVSNDYSFRYNWYYPVVLALLMFLGVYLGVSDGSPKNLLLPISSYGTLLTVLFPFYFASLAATSSLGGVPALDKKFDMSNPVTLIIKLAQGEYKTLHLSPRDFISLLFAYCTTVSLFLLILSFVVPGITALICKIPIWQSQISILLLAFVTLLLSQLLVTTLLGVYFLSDYMVRNRPDDP